MKLEIKQPDPLNILTTTKPVVENAEFVFIDEKRISEISEKILKRFSQGLDTQETGFGVTDDIENDIQLVFIEDVVNFCFWAGKNQPKWQVEQRNGIATEGGWYGLKTCFERAILKGVPILDANYLASISMEDVAEVFKGINDTEIPLAEERAKNLQEAGKILLEKFGGKFINAVNKTNYDAIELTKLIINFFPSFRDVSEFNGNEIIFLKRAQICSNDLNYVLKTKGGTFSNLNKLTAFADYKLPQVLRMFGVLSYSQGLSDKIDNYIEILHDSREEIEIRSATIWAVELLRQKLKKLTAGDIDNTIWLMSQSIQKGAKPYHRTRTIFY